MKEVVQVIALIFGAISVVALILISGAVALSFLASHGPCSGGFVFAGVAGQRGPVVVQIDMDESPRLFDPVDIEASVTFCDEDIISDDFELWLNLPPTAAFIKGEMWDVGSSDIKATVAFVAASQSIVQARVRYARGSNLFSFVDSARVHVTESGREPVSDSPEATVTPVPPNFNYAGLYLTPAPIWTEPNLIFGPTFFVLDGDTLVNRTSSPRVFIIYDRDGLNGLREEGLIPSELWGKWHRVTHDMRTLLDGELEEGTFLVAIFDEQRSTTGYVFSNLRFTPLADNPDTLIVNIISTAPRRGWPVEVMPVSPYEIAVAPLESFTEAIFRVNGVDVARHPVDPSLGSIQEVALADFEPMALPSR